MERLPESFFGVFLPRRSRGVAPCSKRRRFPTHWLRHSRTPCRVTHGGPAVARFRRTGILAVCLLALGPSLARAEEDLALRRGRILYKSGKYKDAIAEHRDALRRDPRNGEALLWLGKSLARMSEYQEAAESLEKAAQVLSAKEDAYAELAEAYVELDISARSRDAQTKTRFIEKAERAAKALLQLPPREKESYEALARVAMYKAQLFRDAGQPDKEREACEEALRYYEKVLELDPKDTSTHLDRIRTLMALGRFKEAEQRCNEVIKLNPSLYQAKVMMGPIRRAEGDTEGALKVFNEILAQKPTQVEALLGRAEICLDLQKYDEALADATEAIRLAEKCPRGNFIRGCVYMQTKKLDAAIGEFQFAAAGMPRDLPSRFWLARCLLMKDRLRDAIEELNAVVKLDPRFTVARLVLASAHLQNGCPDAAIATLEEAIRFDPKHFEVYRLLAMAYDQKGDQKSAQEAFEKMLALDDSPPRASQLLALGDLTRGDADKAIKHCLEALEAEPKNVDVHFLLGLAYLRKDSLDDAKAQFEEVLKLRGRHVGTRLRLAEIHARRREFGLAQRQLEACIADDPKLPGPRYELARIFALQGQFDKAQAELEKLLTLDPDKAKAQRALDDLRRQKPTPPLR
ncbi:MAG: tetratricopeptide repeat protein [Planctomycetes bacterium]|nr:tetratricopeptide repeat protein [Planctomycetota bacterium]